MSNKYHDQYTSRRQRYDTRMGNHLDKLARLNPRINEKMDELQSEINHLLAIRDEAYGRWPDPKFDWVASRAFTDDEIRPIQAQLNAVRNQYYCTHRHVDDYGNYLSCRDCGAADYGNGWVAVIHTPIIASIEAVV